MTMHEQPKTVSENLMPSMFLTIVRHISTKVVPPPFIPKMSFICDDKMINATALVKPDDTGPETKSIRKPSPKNPMRSSVSPVMKQRRTAFCQLPRAVWKVKSDAIAVGPENYEIVHFSPSLKFHDFTHRHILARSQEDVNEWAKKGTVKTVSSWKLCDSSIS